MATEFEHYLMPTNWRNSGSQSAASIWKNSSPQAATSKAAAQETMFVVLASGPSLTEAGVDIRAIKTKALFDFAGLTASGEGFDVHTREMLSHVRLAAFEPRMVLSVENIRDQIAHFSAALIALGQMAPDKLFQAVEQLETAGDHAREGKESLYQVLTAQEMADRMQCSLPVIYQREAADEFFSALAPGRKNGKRFPVFLLSDKLDRALMKRVIQAYKAAGVGTTLMWSFLRSPQKEFGGLTPVEMLLGGAAPAYTGMSRDVRAAAIMDVVDEELSRVR